MTIRMVSAALMILVYLVMMSLFSVGAFGEAAATDDVDPTAATEAS